MPVYAYVARERTTHKLTKGEIDADTVSDANIKLRTQGLMPISVKEPGHGLKLSFKPKGVPLKDKIIFTRQLAVMNKAGLPLVNALEALGRQTENKYFKDVIAQVVREVKGGQPLSKILTRFPKVFPEIYVAAVRAGENTGQLAEVLFNLADQQEKQAEIISKVKGALMYPAVILLALFGVIGLIVFYVLPTLQTIFADYGSELPITTRLLFSTSEILRHYFLFVLAGFAVFVYLMRLWIKRPTGRLVFDRFRLMIPIFGGLTKKVYMANFARTMAMLTHASLPILQSIKIVQKTVNNKLYDDAFTRITAAVENGQALSKAIEREPLFPPMVSQLTSLGEESGNLEAVFMEVARFYDSEVENLTKNLASLIEPIMLLVMGAGVAFVVASVLSPIYKLVGSF